MIDLIFSIYIYFIDNALYISFLAMLIGALIILFEKKRG